MLHLFSNPDIYNKLMAEIDSSSEDNKLSAVPQYDEVLAHCPYYVACIRESMRLNPSAPNIFPRLAPKGGLELDGQFVPEGTELTCNPWLVHRDPNIYGPDADTFRPERWLDPENVKTFNKYNMGFGYGVRSCLGKDMAMMELYKGPLLFLRTFRPTIKDEKTPAKYVVKGGVSYFEDMWLKIEKRT